MNERERLTSAFYFSDLETIKQIVGNDPKGKLCGNDYIIGNFPHSFMPLQYVTVFLKRIFSYDDFLGDYIPIAQEMRKRTDVVMNYLVENQVLPRGFEIDYWFYWEMFCCEEPDADLEDILWDTPDKFIHDDCRMIDLRLYEAVCKFKYNEVTKLLKEGANPIANIYTEDDVIEIDENGEKVYEVETCVSHIEQEISYLASCEVLPIYKEYFKTKDLVQIKERNIHDLLGYAAHDAMWSHIDKNWERNN